MNCHIVYALTLLTSAAALAAWPSSPEKQRVSETQAEVVVSDEVESRTSKKVANKMDSNLIELSSENEFNELINGAKIVVVDFYAEWCGPCKKFGPIFKKIAAEFSDVIFVKVDVDKFKKLTTEKDIKGMPTLIVYKNGKQVSKKPGAFSTADEFRKFLEGLGA